MLSAGWITPSADDTKITVNYGLASHRPGETMAIESWLLSSVSIILPQFMRGEYGVLLPCPVKVRMILKSKSQCRFASDTLQ